MPDPICRWRNPTIKTVREIIDVLPNEVLSKDEFRKSVQTAFGGAFLRTAYQLACQLGLYFEDDKNYYPRFSNVISSDINTVNTYLKNWLNLYYVPNPYTKSLDLDETIFIHSQLVKKLLHSEEVDWNNAKYEIFGQEIGNDDILKNTINLYSDIVEIQSSTLKLKEGARRSDIDKYIIKSTVSDRNDKKFFFEFFGDNYLSIRKFQSPKATDFSGDLSGLVAKFIKDLSGSKLIYDKELILRFVSSLATKPFLILTGLSGSGKTKLAQSFAEWIVEEKNQLNLVPVGADWTNREPLLGYPNALEEGKYVLPESGVLQLILRASKDPEMPYFLILDEMNLSHVERYFADFLSAIESKEEIKLHSGDKNYSADGYEIPSSITIPKNLFIIGTVNIDETTYMFSPKVLDRANVIEFRVSQEELAQFLENPADVDLDVLRNQGASMAKDFVNMAKDNDYTYSQKETLSEELLKFFKELNSVGAEFGYRSAYEIQRFAGLAEQLSEGWEFEQIMDAAIAQKLLPKLHGSRRKLEKVLFRLGDLCYPSLEKGCDDLFKKHDDISEEVIKQATYPISFEKIVRMHKGLVENGFTSFAEA